SGNVWEWCLNEYENPEHTLVSGDATRVLRGGSWFDLAGLASALGRLRNLPHAQYFSYGFRVVVSSSVPI
ncbi:MAG: SUMF1/EgtB/PvdO family nonheme iron enzyme, partial [Chloroflexi bacterium]|nr:SUMF1/EgtB/PvdO family nonheme iron enzyme [Chloroflexota bacterium]